jgi:hypothetical protein
MHRLRGRSSNHQLNPDVLEQALSALHSPCYDGFGPTLANEKLKDLYGLDLSTCALRKVMVQTDLWTSKRYGSKHRAWRQRRSCVGELIQLDGSDHFWFENRGPRCWLIAYIDDATSRILYAEFADAEDTITLMRTTQAYIRGQGRPLAFYVDKDSIYKTSRATTINEELQDLHPLTQYTRAMNELGIEVICAHSPQAKGRIERLFNTLQDRLVKELRLQGISTQEAANQFLWTTYIPAHNAQFAVAPANTTNAHRPLLKEHQLHEILSLRTERTLANDFTLRFQNQYFQLFPDQGLRPTLKLTIEVRLDGSTHLRFKNRYLRYQAIPKPVHKPTAIAADRLLKSLMTSKPHRPVINHPWRRYKGGVQPALFNGPNL